LFGEDPLSETDILDVQTGNVLCPPGLIDEPNEPVVEGEVDIAGENYTALLVPQPLPHFWRWDDDRNKAECYTVILSDLGNGDCIPVSSNHLLVCH
jgi:hypothetical protein